MAPAKHSVIHDHAKKEKRPYLLYQDVLHLVKQSHRSKLPSVLRASYHVMMQKQTKTYE